MIFHNCKGFEKSQFYEINEELLCSDLVLKQTFQLDRPSLCYKAVSTRHLQSVSSFSFNDLTRWLPSVPQKLCNFSRQCEFLYLSRTLAIRGTRLFTCACPTWILAAASIREWRLFRSARLEVRRQFKSGVWSSKYGTCVLVITRANIMKKVRVYPQHESL